jgi:hypothetical protein
VRRSLRVWGGEDGEEKGEVKKRSREKKVTGEGDARETDQVLD